MSSDDEHLYETVDEIGEYNSENEEVSQVENSDNFDDKSSGLNVTDDGDDSHAPERVSTR